MSQDNALKCRLLVKVEVCQLEDEVLSQESAELHVTAEPTISSDRRELMMGKLGPLLRTKIPLLLHETHAHAP